MCCPKVLEVGCPSSFFHPPPTSFILQASIKDMGRMIKKMPQYQKELSQVCVCEGGGVGVCGGGIVCVGDSDT